MYEQQLHQSQVSILRTLRRTDAARFSDMMRPTGQQSDTFKFHLRKLIKTGYIEKLETGAYRLTAKGKEAANNLDEVKRVIQKQPKLSVVLVVSSPGNKGDRRYLFQRRMRQPFFDYWGCISGPVQWGEDFEVAAARELKKQAGLDASFTIKSFYRNRDYDSESGALLEDKLFVVMQAVSVEGQLTNTWSGGHNEWMTIASLKKKTKSFALSHELLEALEEGKIYGSTKLSYDPRNY